MFTKKDCEKLWKKKNSKNSTWKCWKLKKAVMCEMLYYYWCSKKNFIQINKKYIFQQKLQTRIKNHKIFNRNDFLNKKIIEICTYEQ